MATSFFGGAFFNGEFFSAPTGTQIHGGHPFHPYLVLPRKYERLDRAAEKLVTEAREGKPRVEKAISLTRQLKAEIYALEAKELAPRSVEAIRTQQIIDRLQERIEEIDVVFVIFMVAALS